MTDLARPSRLNIAMTCLLAVLACAFLAFMGGLATALTTCGGDGGYPYAAPASPAGRLCDGTSANAYAIAQFFLPVLVLLGAGTYAVVKLRWSGVLLGIAASVTLMGVMYVLPASFSTECSDEQAGTLSPGECETE